MYNYDSDTIDLLRSENKRLERIIKELREDINILKLQLDAKMWTDGK